MRPEKVVRSVLFPALLAGLIAGGYAGAMIGYTLALAHVSTERVEQVEGHADADASMRMALAVSVAWAERWQDVAILATESRVGRTSVHTEAVAP